MSFKTDINQEPLAQFQERYKIINGYLPHAVSNHLAVGTLIAFYFGYYQSLGMIMMWWLILLCISLALRLHFQPTLLKKIQNQDTDRIKFDLLFSITPFINGFTWGIAYTLVAQLGQAHLLLGAAFVICSVAFHGFTYLTHSKACYLSYFVSVFLLPVGYHLLVDQDYFVAIVLLIGCTHFVFFNRLLYDRSTSLLKRHFTNLELIEKQRHIEAKLKYLSETDPLTQLSNRNSYVKQLKFARYHSILKRKSLCIALLDVDHFKPLNDQYGHLTGDKVLNLIANYIATSLDERFSIGRYGGEEFIIFAVGLEEEEFIRQMESLKTGVSQLQLEHIAPDIRVTVSIGASISRREDSLDTLVQVVDVNLYRAKQAGRNQVISSYA